MVIPQVVSRQRVADHGEVYTHPREVNAMLDLVRHETERIESRFLEPACGTGNFLVEIVARKLAVVKAKYAKTQLEYERYAAIAIGSVYGIELLADNVLACQQRLFLLFDQQYTQLYEARCKQACRETIRFILRRNILQGDALTLTTVAEPTEPIVFSEWSVINDGLIRRRDFKFAHLINRADSHSLLLFSGSGEETCLREPVKEYMPICLFALATQE
ncbi:hypothetical protein SAMN05192566_2129 [Methylophilus rhizosphaerae]|uniref:MmeI-like DNA-methyltransferase domain-containing protein n=1 Tax=Methylophilus rhizosphaerae TaxID=492660 RepID=A0A1G9E2D5_9PROT|nr:DNA methyltransferase [Methylophilus rhizosphaerae]SDK70305.1 hypothetical protein SAMN05192566_2129 [Methylophilus rhizosphaerae]